LHLSKHRPHRNLKYLSWLRTRNCVVSGKKAECAHHIRLGTNGGTSLKPSDYFCIPLLNEFHTTGHSALHIIGEETFLKQFSIRPTEVFIKYLSEYLKDAFDIDYKVCDKPEQETISDLIELIESKVVRSSSPIKKKKVSVKKDPTPKVSITESSYYQSAKKLKNERDKELRRKLKEESKNSASPKKQFKGNEFYEKAKELKRIKDKELRKKLKEQSKKK